MLFLSVALVMIAVAATYSLGCISGISLAP
jgi:hypothetical protein